MFKLSERGSVFLGQAAWCPTTSWPLRAKHVRLHGYCDTNPLANETMPPASRPRCFLDVSIGDEPVGRLVIELFADKCPRTAEKYSPTPPSAAVRQADETAAASASCAPASTMACPTRQHPSTASSTSS